MSALFKPSAAFSRMNLTEDPNQQHLFDTDAGLSVPVPEPVVENQTQSSHLRKGHGRRPIPITYRAGRLTRCCR